MWWSVSRRRSEADRALASTKIATSRSTLSGPAPVSESTWKERMESARRCSRRARLVPSNNLVARLRLLLDIHLARPVTAEALEPVTSLFGTPHVDGITMAVWAARESGGPAGTIAGPLVALVDELQDTLENQ